MTVLAYLALLWFAAGPWTALGIGIRRGHSVTGWLCGLVPLAGPFLALWLIPSQTVFRPGSGCAPRPSQL
jgi:hypothetical protein